MRSKKYFDLVAHRWNRMWEGFFLEAVRDKAFSADGVQKNKIPADIGASSGFIIEGGFAKNFG